MSSAHAVDNELALTIADVTLRAWVDAGKQAPDGFDCRELIANGVMTALALQRQEISTLRDALDDMVDQFAYTSGGNQHTGGLSPLETAFAALGYPDPRPLPDYLRCQHPGCVDASSCGTPTPGGYTRLCSKHFDEVRR